MVKIDERESAEDAHRRGAMPGPCANSMGSVNNVLSGRLPGLTGDLNLPSGEHGRSSSVDSAENFSARTPLTQSPLHTAHAVSTPPEFEAVDSRKVICLDEYMLESVAPSTIDQKALIDAFDSKIEAKLAELETSLMQRLSQPTMSPAGDNDTSMTHIAGCVEGLLSNSGEHRQQVDRMEVMVRREVDELKAWCDSQQSDIAKLVLGYESIQARLEDMRKENQGLLAKLEVNNCRVITLQGEIGTLQSVKAKGGDEPSAEAYAGLADLTSNLQCTVEMLETRLESVRVQHEEAFRKSDELLETEVQARAAEAHRRSLEVQRLENVEQKCLKLEQFEASSSSMHETIRSLMDRSQTSLQDRLDGVQNQIVQLLDDLDSVQTRSEERLSVLDTMETRMSSCEKSASKTTQDLQNQISACERLETILTCCREEHDLLKQQVQKVQWNVDQASAQDRDSALEQLQVSYRGCEERLAVVETMQKRMTFCEQSVSTMLEDLQTQSSMCQRLDMVFAGCREQYERLQEQVERVESNAEKAFAQANSLNGDSTSRTAQLSALENNLDMLKQNGIEAKIAYQSKIGDLQEQMALMLTGSEALAAHCNEIETTSRSRLDDLQRRSDSSLATAEDMRRILYELDATSKSRSEELQGTIKTVSEDLDRKLAFNIEQACKQVRLHEARLVDDDSLKLQLEELRKQIHFEVETNVARFADGDSLTSQLEEMRTQLNLEVKAIVTRLVDGESLTSQLDEVRRQAHLEMEASVARLVDGDSLTSQLDEMRRQMRGEVDTIAARVVDGDSLASHIEEVRKQVLDAIAAKLSHGDALTSQLEDLRLRTETFAARIPDGDALGLQIDGLRGQVEAIAASSVDTETFSVEIQRLHGESSELQSRYANLQALASDLDSKCDNLRRREGSETYRADIEGLQHSCGHLQVQLTQLKARQGDYDELLQGRGGHTASRQEPSATIDASGNQFAEVQGALLGMQARVEESCGQSQDVKLKLQHLIEDIETLRSSTSQVLSQANDVDALRRSIGELQERMETGQTGGKLSTRLFSMLSRSTSGEQLPPRDTPENSSSETTGQDLEPLRRDIVQLKSEAQKQHNAIQEVQQLMASMQSQSEVIREQMEETLRESGEQDSGMVIDRLEELQANFESLHNDHVAVMSVAERVETLERTAVDTSNACRQVIQCLPADGQFCSISHLEQKVEDVREETQERIAVLGETLSRDLAQTIASQMTARSPSAPNEESSHTWIEKLEHCESRLSIIEKAAQNVDIDSLVRDSEDGVREALKQIATRLDLLQLNSESQFGDVDRTGMLVRSEIDVIRSLQKLTGSTLEAIQERMQNLEARSVDVARADNADARFEDLQNFAITLDTLAAGFVEIRGDVDNHSLRIDQLGDELLRAGQVQNEGLEAVSAGIKDYIMNLIETMDSKRPHTPILSDDYARDELIQSARSQNTGSHSVPYSVASAPPSKASVVVKVAHPLGSAGTPHQADRMQSNPVGSGSGRYRQGGVSPVVNSSGVVNSRPKSNAVPTARVVTTSAPSAVPQAYARNLGRIA